MKRLCFILLFLSFNIQADEGSFLACKDEVTLKLIEFLKNDKSNFIGKQFHLTTLKLSSLVVSDQRNTLEEYSKSLEKEIKSLHGEKLEKLKEIYKLHGKSDDLQAIIENFDTGVYWDRTTRFYNEDTSFFIMAHQTLEDKSPLNETDAAITWLMNSLSSAAIEIEGFNSAIHNLTNTTNRIVKYTGTFKGSRKLTNAELTRRMRPLEKNLLKTLVNWKNDFKETLKDTCFKNGLFSGICQFSENFYNELFASALGQVKGLFDDTDAVQITLSNEIKASYKGKFAFDLMSFRKEKYIETPSSIEVGEIRLKSTAVPNQWENGKTFVFLSDIDNWHKEINELPNEAKIIRFHQYAKKGDFIVVDKESGVLKVYDGSGALKKEIRLDQLDLGDDRKQVGGSGKYSFVKIGKSGELFIQDERGNVRPLALNLDIDLPKGSSVYILPNNKDHSFKVMDGKIHFRTEKSKTRYNPYNFSKKDSKYFETKTFIQNPQKKTKTAVKFVQAMDKEKKKIMEIYNLSNSEYNKLSKYAFGILGQESSFGESFKYKVKEALPFAVALAKGNWFDTSRNSRGPTQIKRIPAKIKENYSFKKSELENPEYAAIATVGFLAQSLKELKIKEKYHPDINEDNRMDYLYYIYRGKSKEITQGTATPHLNINARKIKEHGESLTIYQAVDE